MVKNLSAKVGDTGDAGDSIFDLWVIRKIPWRGKRQLTLVFLPGKFHGQRSLMGYSPWGCRVGHDLVSEQCTHATNSSHSSIYLLCF